MINNELMIIAIVMCYLSYFGISATIFSNPTVFHAQYCPIGYHTPGTRSIPCVTATPQKDIIRTAVAFTQFSKPQITIFRLELSASYTSDPTTSFNIDVVYNNPVAGMKIGVFLVIIKQQRNNLFIDLVNFSNQDFNFSLEWETGSTLDGYIYSSRSDTKSADLTLSTIFTTVPTSGLVAIPFVTSWRILVQLNTTQGFYDTNVPIEFQTVASIAGNTLTLTLTVSAQNKVQQFKVFVLLFNPSQVATSNSNGMRMRYLNHPYSMGSTLDLTSVGVDYGPGFNPKCIFGFHHFKFLGAYNFNYDFTNTVLGNYSVYNQISGVAAEQYGTFFCFGNGTGCGQGYSHVDFISMQCYLANTCPLPVFTGWNQPNICPSCIQLICQTCDVSTRNLCSKCATNSHLVGSKCVCDTNCIEILTPIDTSSLGLWNNNNQSLSQCKLNCSAVIQGCKLYDCTNSTYCTVCEINYVLLLKNATHQNCTLCSLQIPNCLICFNIYICSACRLTSFITYTLTSGVVTNSTCTECLSVIPHCTSCPDNLTCNTCEVGYFVNGVTKQCDCNVTFQNLLNCDTCSITSQCTKCSDLFYLNMTTYQCQPCFDINSKCMNCSNQFTCTQCQTGFALDPNRLPGKVTCTQCRLLISNCSECSSATTCTNCDTFYGLNAQQCFKCDTLIMPGCQLCEDAIECISCVSTARMVNNVCRFCSQTPYCIDCFVTPTFTLSCVKCADSFFISPDTITGQMKCETCQNICDYCKDCVNLNECLSCYQPYLIGSTGICDQCIAGYQYMGGFCIGKAGCINLIVTPQGKDICLACASSLHFVLDRKTMKCVCDVGYQEYTPLGSLLTCQPICGDGMTLLGQEECDDKNTENDDGCDMNCKVQSGFQCSIQQPSQCILLLEIKSFSFNYALRVIPQNKAILSFTIQPAVIAFKKLNWKKLLKLQFFSQSAVKLQNLNFQYSLSTNEILITLPYHEELQSTILQTTLKLDPSVIKSQGKQLFLMANQLKGKNAPLIFESADSLSAYGNINTISMIIVVVLLVQFYLGSYTHKMIGLQTIQAIQTFYFARMIASSTSSSLLQSMNTIQYSATGYQNAQLIFGSSYDSIKSQGFSELSPQFIAISLQKLFLMNINLSYVPVIIVIVLFFVKLRQKITKRQQFLLTKQQQEKQNFIEARRSCSWIYEHFVFPFVMMFNMVCFFFTVLCFTTNSKTQPSNGKMIEMLSYPLHTLMLFGTVVIYCAQILKSYDQYAIYRMSEKERQRRILSLIEKLQQDGKNPDRANYHPLYVLIYCFYYLILEICLVFGVLFKQFTSKLELTLAITTIYFIFIIIWKPYHQSVNIHNKFLIFNHASLLIFLVICEVFAKSSKLSPTFYIVSMYLLMVLLTLIMIGGFVRIFLQNKFRKSLQQNSSLLDQITKPQNQQNQVQNNQKKNNTEQVLPKHFGLIANNPYVFNNQLKVLGKQYGIGQQINQLTGKAAKNKLTIEEQKYIVDKIRQQNKRKKQQNFIKEILINQQSDTFKKSKASSNQRKNLFFPPQILLQENNLQFNGEIQNDDQINLLFLESKNTKMQKKTKQATRLIEIKAKLRHQLKTQFL